MFPKLESYEVSGADYPGEGEKKIMELIIPEFKNKNNTYCILSPDADLVLLAMILTNINHFTYKNDLNYINVLHNPEINNYSYVNTDKFINFICKYVNKDLIISVFLRNLSYNIFRFCINNISLQASRTSF